VYSRAIVGWAMSQTLGGQLTTDALAMAISRRGVPELVHSDRGSTYATSIYLDRIRRHGIRQSMSRKGNMVVAGDNPGRLRNDAALAAFCGASPLPASSGKSQRHRLNRGGSWEANNALWTIALVRMRSDARTRGYVARRTAECLSSKEIQRCLKRYIVRELYPLILADLRDATITS
jgi:transposase